MPSDITQQTAQPTKRTPKGQRLGGYVDTMTTFGLLLGFALLGTAILFGGSLHAFVDSRAILIVFAGTFAVTAVSFSLEDIFRTQRILIKSLMRGPPDANAAAHQILGLAEQARQQGVLALQDVIPDLQDRPFLARGLQLAADGLPGDQVERIMRQEMMATAERHSRGVAVLYRAADVAPAMGLIGTLVGLVQMLGRLEDPATIGPSMAVALLTTFYGAVLANMVFTPLATKLEKNAAEERALNEVYVLGVSSIGRQENPRSLEILLNTVLPPSKRVSYFE